MNRAAPFSKRDLEELDARLLSRARSVVAMQEIVSGNARHDTIALRHDVDAGYALKVAANMAEWEGARGYRSTYFILHTSPYWGKPEFPHLLDRIASAGHEIGMHTNALAEASRTGGDPDLILEGAVSELRALGYPVRGVVGHGDPYCNRDAAAGEIWFANDEQFVECARPKYGEPDREITRGSVTFRLAPRPLSDFGFDYEAVRLPRGFTNTDSGGRWYYDFDETVEAFRRPPGQLHLLVHPDWWSRAF